MLNNRLVADDSRDPRSWIEGYLEIEPEVLFRVGYSMARRILNGDRDAAEDVVQDAFMKIIRTARSGTAARPEDPIAYFCSAVSSAAKDHLKRIHAAFRGGGQRPQSLSVDGNITIVSEAPDPLDLASNSLLRDRIYSSIAMLKPDHRDILLLAFDPVAGDFGGHSHAELSAHFRIQISTVKSRLFEAKKKLAALLRDLESGEEGVSA